MNSHIETNNYIVITGNLFAYNINKGSTFISNTNPVKVFVGGKLNPANITKNQPDYPVFNCEAPTTIPYLNTGCSYGNMDDFADDPKYPFFQSTCTNATANSNSPVCSGNTLNLTSSGVISYRWIGPNGFTSNAQNPTIPNASTAMTGDYTVTVTAASGCAVEATTSLIVNAIPVTPVIAANGPTAFCAGDSVTLTSSTGTSYLWSNGESTSSIHVTSGGSYTVQVSNAGGCQSAMSTSTTVNVNALPIVNITSSSSGLCISDVRTLTGSPSGGTFMVIDGPGNITGNILTATGAGDITLEYNYTDVCANSAGQTIIVSETPVANAGPDQELTFVFETQMNAELSSSETGEWSLLTGSGQLNDIHLPTTRVNELSIGENKFLWQVYQGSCEATDEVVIVVHDMVTPTVITPNGDGLNDELIFPGLTTAGSTIIIFNRWGSEVYRNTDYKNDWNGKDHKSRDLQPDTYYYVFSTLNGYILKGFVEIIR